MKIVMRQVSGLGNQLFQHAAGRYFAQRYEGRLSMIVDPPERQFSHGTFPRPFLLPQFSIESTMRQPNQFDRLLNSERRLIRPIADAVKRALGIQLFTEPHAQRYTFIRDLPLGPGVRSVYLSGYWQAHQFAAAVEQQLRADFAFRHAAEGTTLALLGEIEAAEAPVSLHVRRGDYKLAAEGNRTLPLDYYWQAIAGCQRQLRKPTFFIFSDDIPFCRSAFAALPNATFVGHNDDFTAHDDLRLMAACHHHIIANSSFSWWGAWLNSRDKKLVFAPKYWHLSQPSFFPDLFPENWTTLAF